MLPKVSIFAVSLSKHKFAKPNAQTAAIYEKGVY